MLSENSSRPHRQQLATQRNELFQESANNGDFNKFPRGLAELPLRIRSGLPVLLCPRQHELNVFPMAYQYDVFFSYKRDPESDHWHENVKTKLEFWLKHELNRSRV